MKIFVILMTGVLSFFGMLAGLLAMTGNLSADSVRTLVSGEPAKLPVVPAETSEGTDLDAVARALKDRSDELSKEKTSVDEEKKRVEMAKKDLEAIRNDAKKLLEQMEQSIQAVQGQSDVRITEIANSIAQMKPNNAATALMKLETDTAAKVLMQIDEKKRGKILDAMPQEDTNRLLSAIQQPGK
ncbi:MAG TPA: hypothetical protein PLO62_01925 [Candidatus Hydrogenedentes bacterium]|nr:hypothetical protein [Candidatus Hydrogenedentota bacterium]HOS02011.1 hypothetical protein [Candidatus Hydrogenedentota bacterium]